VHENTNDAQGAFFDVPAKHKGQKPILFGRFEFKPITHESLKDNDETPKFFHYRPSTQRMMEKMGYNLTKRSGLNFDKGRRILLRSFLLRGKASDYYQ